MKHAGKLSFVAGALIVAGAGYVMGMGPLDPPAGPVQPTGPSLADLEAKIDAIGAPASDFNTGPWQIARVPATGILPANQFDAIQLVAGRVYVKSITAYWGSFALFDGPGSVDTGRGDPATANWIARNSDDGDYGSGVRPGTVPVEQIAENGLYIAWGGAGTANAFAYVLYRPLEAAP
jgi:hypothetical protein